MNILDLFGIFDYEVLDDVENKYFYRKEDLFKKLVVAIVIIIVIKDFFIHIHKYNYYTILCFLFFTWILGMIHPKLVINFGISEYEEKPREKVSVVYSTILILFFSCGRLFFGERSINWLEFNISFLLLMFSSFIVVAIYPQGTIYYQWSLEVPEKPLTNVRVDLFKFLMLLTLIYLTILFIFLPVSIENLISSFFNNLLDIGNLIFSFFNNLLAIFIYKVNLISTFFNNLLDKGNSKFIFLKQSFFLIKNIFNNFSVIFLSNIYSFLQLFTTIIAVDTAGLMSLYNQLVFTLPHLSLFTLLYLNRFYRKINIVITYFLNLVKSFFKNRII